MGEVLAAQWLPEPMPCGVCGALVHHTTAFRASSMSSSLTFAAPVCWPCTTRLMDTLMREVDRE